MVARRSWGRGARKRTRSTTPLSAATRGRRAGAGRGQGGEGAVGRLERLEAAHEGEHVAVGDAEGGPGRGPVAGEEAAPGDAGGRAGTPGRGGTVQPDQRAGLGRGGDDQTVGGRHPPLLAGQPGRRLGPV